MMMVVVIGGAIGMIGMLIIGLVDIIVVGGIAGMLAGPPAAYCDGAGASLNGEVASWSRLVYSAVFTRLK
jgi:hypothetical protein